MSNFGLPLAPPEGSLTDLHSLNATYGADGVVFVEGGPNSPSTKALLTCGGARAEVYLFGACVTSW